jgi:hypothetical protein
MVTAERFVNRIFLLLFDNEVLQAVGLRASTNNRAITVLDVFLDAADKHGYPSRMRGDRGGENISCAIYMVMQNGSNRALFMRGS